MPNVKQWISFFRDKKNTQEYLKKDYGENYPQIKVKQKFILDVLKLHLEKFGNEDVILARTPGRINLMGRHVDHQGGAVNLIAIDKEIFLTASLRDDSKIKAHNVENKHFPCIEFEPSTFSINYTIPWNDFINDHKLIKEIRSPNGEWDNYFKAVFLRLNFMKKTFVKGANFSVVGNIPIAAGVSSSSALIVGIFQILTHFNQIKMPSNSFITYCAEAEWFVGTRGGAADHVAIKLGKKNKIAHAKFFDLEILEYVEFPKNYKILLCNTQIIADKSGKKRDLYNEKVLAYHIGFQLIKNKLPQFRAKINLLKDINPETLSISTKEILKILLKIPEYINYQDLPKLLGSNWDSLKKRFKFKNPPKRISIRKVISYGISECERSKIFIEFIKNCDFQSIGEIMYISHDGDRIINYSSQFQEISHNNELSSELVNRLLQKRVRLYEIPGGYGCSIPEIDYIVDISKQIEGVLGAQLSGAGLGGSAMVLVEKNLVNQVKKSLKEAYLNKFKKICSIFACRPVNGSSIYSHF